MIDSKEYPDSKSLERAMYHEHRAQVSEMMMSKLRSLTADIDQMHSLVHEYPFANEVANLDKKAIYWRIDRIEELAKRTALTASIMKSTSRYIQEPPKEDDSED